MVINNKPGITIIHRQQAIELLHMKISINIHINKIINETTTINKFIILSNKMDIMNTLLNQLYIRC
jgi:hypothetical protein